MRISSALLDADAKSKEEAKRTALKAIMMQMRQALENEPKKQPQMPWEKARSRFSSDEINSKFSTPLEREYATELSEWIDDPELDLERTVRSHEVTPESLNSLKESNLQNREMMKEYLRGNGGEQFTQKEIDAANAMSDPYRKYREILEKE